MDAPHDGYEAEQLKVREAAMRALCGRTVFWRHESGVQYVAIVTAAYSPEVVNLLVLGTAGIELGAGPGVPVPKLSVPRGAGHLCWQTELDP